MNKQAIRTYYLQKRLALTEAEYQQWNFLISEQFFVYTDLAFVHTLHLYLPLLAKKEPDTWPIINKLRRDFPHIRLSIPRVESPGVKLKNFYFEGPQQLERNTWGIEEPRDGVITDPSHIDLVIIPLLAYDHRGHRIGYGKGYYDQFLKQCRNDTKKIGLSFFPPTDMEFHPDEHDVALDEVVTPFGHYGF